MPSKQFRVFPIDTNHIECDARRTHSVHSFKRERDKVRPVSGAESYSMASDITMTVSQAVRVSSDDTKQRPSHNIMFYIVFFSSKLLSLSSSLHLSLFTIFVWIMGNEWIVTRAESKIPHDIRHIRTGEIFKWSFVIDAVVVVFEFVIIKIIIVTHYAAPDSTIQCHWMGKRKRRTYIHIRTEWKNEWTQKTDLSTFSYIIIRHRSWNHWMNLMVSKFVWL